MSSKERKDVTTLPSTEAPGERRRSEVAEWARQPRIAQEAELDPIDRIRLALQLGLRAKRIKELAGR